MNEYLTIFGVGYLSVFAAGFQSRCVNSGNVLLAMGNSFFIGLSSAALWAHVTQHNTLAGGTIYGLSGSLAIASSMWVHKKFVEKPQGGAEKPQSGAEKK